MEAANLAGEMKIVLGGYLETAVVRNVDEVIRPDRNKTGNPYYICLNRKVQRAYFDRSATFIALAQEVIIPQIDWALSPGSRDVPELSSERLGVSINGPENFGGREWDDDTGVFVDILLACRALSRDSWVHVSRLDISEREMGSAETSETELRKTVGHHYLCRLLLQVRAAADAGAILVLSEPDCVLLKEIGAFLIKHKLPAPYALPDLTDQVLAGDDFAGGLFNFSPPDALAMAAVKGDPVVQRYARRVNSYLSDVQVVESQRQLLRAMKEAHGQAEAGRKAEKVFEVASWLIKPLHYIPGVGEALTLAEDAKDAANKWMDLKIDAKEWYLLAAKMSDVAISDYLSRKGNIL